MNHKAVYLDVRDRQIAPSSERKPARVKAGLAMLFSLALIVFAFLPAALGLMSDSSQNQNTSSFSDTTVAQASAAGVLCKGLGDGMNDKSNWSMPMVMYPDGESPGRTFTAKEMFWNSAKFVNFYGENPDPGFFFEPREVHESLAENPKIEDIKNARGFVGCGVNFTGRGISNMILSLSSAFVELSTFIVTMAFNPAFICQPDAPEGGFCFDLAGFIGGNGGAGDNGGIIGALTKSVYLPLVTFVAAIAGIWMLVQGAKGRMRKALSGFVWIFAASILSMVALGNPQLLARAPMTVTNTLASCVLNTMSGSNCVTGEGGQATDMNTGNSSEANVCISRTSGSGVLSGMSMTMEANSVGCEIWVAFVLNPVANGSFGTQFVDLDAYSDRVQPLIERAGYDPKDFCVNMSSSGSAEGMRNKTLVNDSNNVQVCNLMIYQMYLMTNVSMTGELSEEQKSVADENWYKLINVISQDDGMWSSWESSNGSAFAEDLALALVSLLISTVGGVVIGAIGAFALLYYIMCLFLMIFAPFFLLLAIEPSRGKRIFFGWLEQIVGNILRYAISAVMLVIALAIYSAVLTNTSNLALTVVFIIILSLALLLYRRELMNLLGRANMGGEQLTTNAMESIKNGRTSRAAKRAKNIANAGVGSAIGSALAGGNMRRGAAEGMFREAKRGTGVLAATAKSVDTISRNNKSDLHERAKNAQNTFAEAQNRLADVQEQRTTAVGNANATLGAMNSTKGALDGFTRTMNKRDALASNVLNDMTGNVDEEYRNNVAAIRENDNLTDEQKQEHIDQLTQEYNENKNVMMDFSALKGIEDAIRNLKIEMAIAERMGDTEKYAALSQKMDELNEQKAAIIGSIDPKKFDVLDDQFETTLNDEMEARGVEFDDRTEEMIISHQISLAQDKQVLLGHMDKIKTLNGDIDAAMIDSVQAKTQADVLNEKYLNLSAGDVYTVRQMEEDMVEAVKASEESALLVNRSTDDADLNKFDAALGSYQDLNLPIVTAAPRFDDDDTLPLPDDLVDQNDGDTDTNPLPVVPVENGDSDEDDLPEINKDATAAESDRAVPVVLPVATRDVSGNADDPEVDTTTPDFGESRREEFMDGDRDLDSEAVDDSDVSDTEVQDSDNRVVSDAENENDDLPEIDNGDSGNADSTTTVPVVAPTATRTSGEAVSDDVESDDVSSPDFGPNRREEFIDNNRDDQFSHEQAVSDTSTESTSGDDVDDLPDIETGPTTSTPVVSDALSSDEDNSGVQTEDGAQNAVDADDDLPDVPASITPAAAPRVASASTVESDADSAVESPVNNFAGDRRDEVFAAAPVETERVDSTTDPVTQEDAVVNADTAADTTVEDTAVSDRNVESASTPRDDSNEIDATAIAGAAVAGAVVVDAVRDEPQERAQRVDRNDDFNNDNSRKSGQSSDILNEEFDRIEADVYADDDRIRSERREREAATPVDAFEGGVDRIAEPEVTRIERDVEPETVVTERVEVSADTPVERVATETVVVSTAPLAAEAVVDQPRTPQERGEFSSEARIMNRESVEPMVREIDNANSVINEQLAGTDNPDTRQIMNSANRVSQDAHVIQQSMNESMEKMNAVQQVIASPDVTHEQIQESLKTLSAIERDMRAKSAELNDAIDKISLNANKIEEYPSNIVNTAMSAINSIESNARIMDDHLGDIQAEVAALAASRGLQPHMERIQQIENDSQSRLDKFDDNLRAVSASARADVESSAQRASLSENEISQLASQVRRDIEGSSNPMLLSVADQSDRAQRTSHNVSEAMTQARKEIDQIQQSINSGSMNKGELDAATRRLESISRDLNEQKNQLNRTIEDSLDSVRRSGAPAPVLNQVVTDINRLKDGTDAISREINTMSSSIDSFSRDLKTNVSERDQVIVGRDAQIAQVSSEPPVAPVVDPVVTSTPRITPSAPSRTETPVSDPQRPSERVSAPEPTPAPKMDERGSQGHTEAPQRDTGAEERTQRLSRPERGEVKAPRNRQVVEAPSDRSFPADSGASNDVPVSGSENAGMRQQDTTPSRRKQKIDQRRSREDIVTGDINTSQRQESTRRPVNEETTRGSESSERLSGQDNMGNRDFNAEFRRAKDDIGPKGFGESRRLAKIRRERNKKEG